MLLVIADDLTGALDSAAPFAGRGLHAEVALTLEGIAPALAERPDVLSIDLACREKTAQQARALAASALRLLPGVSTIFVKIDSRMKGHVEAVLDAIPFSRALVAPAIPEFGRIVTDGAVRGFGVETPIDIAAALGRHVRACDVPDTVSQVDMIEALAHGQREGCDLWVGARGLADALAQSMRNVLPQQAGIPAGAALLVIGSRDPITLRQIERLRQSVEIDDRPAENGRLVNRSAIAKGITLIQAVDGAEVCSAEEVSDHLAEGVVPGLVDQVKTLLLCGGATAEAVLHRMGIHRFRLLGECLPGLGLAQTGQHCIIAKSGGFGQPDTLREIATTILGKTG
ncbi:four-carbon acid sugar kinase family protein [Rhizobium straminoryzae]|uniref:Four-carbon acid sugar kinase family protein n=1 Tax=Rhizobium straminoryzae TaxID=1387186 RepID=A0A549TF77_9HYPH|nr:four-carbon acid sugar kinase family protein [Rhizobium straminoryzae]TRL41170.1 four-carbon acid sugar kinase family protein [Rhizobium straminoryzae]